MSRGLERPELLYVLLMLIMFAQGRLPTFENAQNVRSPPGTFSRTTQRPRSHLASIRSTRGCGSGKLSSNDIKLYEKFTSERIQAHSIENSRIGGHQCTPRGCGLRHCLEAFHAAFFLPRTLRGWTARTRDLSSSRTNALRRLTERIWSDRNTAGRLGKRASAFIRTKAVRVTR